MFDKQIEHKVDYLLGKLSVLNASSVYSFWGLFYANVN